jgi:hypothetical protein
MKVNKPLELDFSKDKEGEEIKIFEGKSGIITPKRALAIIPERGLKLPKAKKKLPNLRDKRTFYLKVSTENKHPPCKLMFAYEKNVGSIDIYAATKDKIPNGGNCDNKSIGKRPLCVTVPEGPLLIE